MYEIEPTLFHFCYSFIRVWLAMSIVKCIKHDYNMVVCEKLLFTYHFIRKGNVVMLKRCTYLFILLIVSGLLVACGSDGQDETPTDNETSDEVNNEAQEEVEEVEEVELEDKPEATDYSSDDNPVVTIAMENDGEITIELYPEVAPNTVNNFISLVEDEFYDGLIFHRVIPSFMIQGGDPEGTGMGGPGYSIKGEFAANGFENDLRHERGVISMARANDPNSAGSQFFIMTDDAEHLDGDYAAFGKVLEGMHIVDKIVHSERDGNDKPVEDQVMEKVTVELRGYEPSEVEKE